MGPTAGAVPYFEALPGLALRLPQQRNPSDWLLDTLADHDSFPVFSAATEPNVEVATPPPFTALEMSGTYGAIGSRSHRQGAAQPFSGVGKGRPNPFHRCFRTWKCQLFTNCGCTQWRRWGRQTLHNALREAKQLLR